MPLLFAVFLKRNREVLSTPQELREHNPSLDSLRLLFEGYRPEFFYWELVSTGRRLFLIGVLVVVDQGNVLQLAIGLFVGLLTITIHTRYWPFEGNLENT